MLAMMQVDAEGSFKVSWDCLLPAQQQTLHADKLTGQLMCEASRIHEATPGHGVLFAKSVPLHACLNHTTYVPTQIMSTHNKPADITDLASDACFEPYEHNGCAPVGICGICV